MKARAKSSDTPYPIWIYGEYITNPPKRPVDGAIRPAGHYIDKGGYPGANVYAVNAETLCRQTETVDRYGKEIYVQDIILYETEAEIGYFAAEEEGTAIDIVWGEIVPLRSLGVENTKIIGNLIDFPEILEGMAYCRDNEMEIPYIPLLNTQLSGYPYFKLECARCKHIEIACRYKIKCEKCGGFLRSGFTKKIYREKEKAFA